MIDGVTVLSYQEVYTNLSQIILILIFTVIMIVGGIIVTILAVRYDWENIYIVIASIGILCVAILPVFFLPLPKHIVYKVTVDDSVSMAEFNEKYDILSTEGLIYEICLKEGD